MKLGMIGLGRMGGNMVKLLQEKGHKVVGMGRHKPQIQAIQRLGAIGVMNYEDLVSKLPKPATIWLMIPSKVVDKALKDLLPLLKPGDTIVDGGNSYFKDSLRRHKMLKKKKINFLDVGTSGGVSGARHGACMMIGGSKKIFSKLEKVFKDLCVKDGYALVGGPGAGHFVKMVHNGIEYGMLGALAEGMQAIHKSKFSTNMKEVAKVYANGSIIESRLTSWMQEAYDKNLLSTVKGTVPKGETEEEMQNLEKMADMQVLRAARLMRVKTRKKPSYAGKIVAIVRNLFGGHAVRK